MQEAALGTCENPSPHLSANFLFIVCEIGVLRQERLIYVSDLEERIVSHKQKQTCVKEWLWNFTEGSFSHCAT